MATLYPLVLPTVDNNPSQNPTFEFDPGKKNWNHE